MIFLYICVIAFLKHPNISSMCSVYDRGVSRVQFTALTPVLIKTTALQLQSINAMDCWEWVKMTGSFPFFVKAWLPASLLRINPANKKNGRWFTVKPFGKNSIKQCVWRWIVSLESDGCVWRWAGCQAVSLMLSLLCDADTHAPSDNHLYGEQPRAADRYLGNNQQQKDWKMFCILKCNFSALCNAYLCLCFVALYLFRISHLFFPIYNIKGCWHRMCPWFLPNNSSAKALLF